MRLATTIFLISFLLSHAFAKAQSSTTGYRYVVQFRVMGKGEASDAKVALEYMIDTVHVYQLSNGLVVRQKAESIVYSREVSPDESPEAEAIRQKAIADSPKTHVNYFVYKRGDEMGLSILHGFRDPIYRKKSVASIKKTTLHPLRWGNWS